MFIIELFCEAAFNHIHMTHELHEQDLIDIGIRMNILHGINILKAIHNGDNSKFQCIMDYCLEY